MCRIVPDRRHLFWILLLGLLAIGPGVVARQPIPAPAGKPNLLAAFLSNQGQWPADWHFASTGMRPRAAFGPDRVLIDFAKSPLSGSTDEPAEAGRPERLDLVFRNTAGPVSPRGEHPLEARVNWLLGARPSKRLDEVRLFQGVRYANLWPGIDLTFASGEEGLKYDLRLTPGSRLSDVGLAYGPVRRARLDPHGNLNLETAWGVLTDLRPEAYQLIGEELRSVSSRFVLLPSPRGEAHFGFELTGPYDASAELVIDPGLVYSSYLGGQGTEHLPSPAGPNLAVAVDARGNTYLGGVTDSLVFSLQDSEIRSSFDLYLARFGPTGQLGSVSFLGGTGDESLGAVIAGPGGRVYLAGATDSPDYPTSRRALQRQPSGGLDGFVTILEGGSGELVASTLLGGRGRDSAADLTVLRDGTIFLTGTTTSPDYPTAQPTFSQNYRGGEDAFLTRLGPALQRVEFSTHLGGGPENDRGRSLIQDGQGFLWLLGETENGFFPGGTGEGGRSSGGWDIYLSRWDIAAQSLTGSTLWGGSGDEYAGDFQLDSGGHLRVVGVTSSRDLDTAAHAFQPFHGGGSWDLFLTRFGVGTLQAEQSTYWGGSGDDGGPLLRPSLALDARGNWHLACTTWSLDFPLTPQAARPDPPESDLPDAAYSKLSSQEKLLYSSLWGGGGADFGVALAVDARGAARLAGLTSSPDLPMRDSAQPFFAGGRLDAFLAELADPFAAAVLVGLEAVRVKSGARIHSGDVVVHQAGELRLQRGAEHRGAGFQLRADRIIVERGARVSANSIFNSLEEKGATTGERITPLPLPALPGLPPFEEVTVDLVAQPDVRLARGHHLVLVSGTYRDVELGQSATLFLEGGDYQVRSVSLKKGARIFFARPARMRVAAGFKSDKDCWIGPLPDGGATGADLLVFVAEREAEWAVDLGQSNQVEANFYAPFSGLRFKKSSKGRGAFWARRADLETEVELVLDSAFADPEPPPNQPPLAQDDELRLREDTSGVVDLLANDRDPDGDQLRLILLGQTLHGTVEHLAGGSVRYRPPGDFFGEDAFSYRISDGRGGANQATVAVRVLPVNDPPAARDDSAATVEDQPVSIDVLANDHDVDGDPLTVVSVSQPEEGRVESEPNGALLFRPALDFHGTARFGYTVADVEGAVDAAQVDVEVEPVNDPPRVSLSARPTLGEAPLEAAFQAQASDPDGDPLEYRWDFGDGTRLDGGPHQTHLYAEAGLYEATVQVSDGRESATAGITIEAFGGLPPDPAAIAPPLDTSVATTVASATRFLYQAERPVQFEVEAGSLRDHQVSLLRGRVLDRAGNSLPGVTIKVLGQPQWGFTRSRADGEFDLAVNGGSRLTLDIRKEGFLPAQRQLEVPRQSYRRVAEVVLIRPDSRATLVESGSTRVQVVQANPVTDPDGTRQATLLFPPGLTAEMVEADGSRQLLDSWTVRATEFTVGENGPLAMPAELPPTSLYTYAVALTVDEAGASGARRVDFSKPIPFYLENFLGLPVGLEVPLGSYDNRRAAWSASPSGRILRILRVEQGRALLDVDGSGAVASAEELSRLGVEEEELRELARLYGPGQELWRTAIPHFSIWDLNWGWALPDSATWPVPLRLLNEFVKRLRDFCVALGSLIECQNQTLGEALPLAGTPFSLHYRSDRMAGRLTERSLRIDLSGDSVPDGLLSIELEIEVAGQFFAQSFPPEPQQVFRFEWDGLDGYGRPVQGGQKARVRLGYTYQGGYAVTDRFGEAPYGSITGSLARTTLTLWTEQEAVLGPFWDARSAGLGGWTLSHHHVYDPIGQILYLGTGERRSTANLPLQFERLAVEALSEPRRLASLPDGSLLIVDGVGGKVLKRTPDGVVTAVAGNGASFGPPGDGGPATQARLVGPDGITAAADGSFYVAEASAHRIRRVAPDGTIWTIAGDGTPGFGGDGGPAAAAQLNLPQGLALGPDGSLYVSDFNNRAIRKISPAGLISRVAGDGAFGSGGDGGPAREAQLSGPIDVAVSSEGILYVADFHADRIRRVDPDGRISTFAGGRASGTVEEGVPAVQARLFDPRGLAVAPDGSVFVSEGDSGVNQHRVRRILPTGLITTHVGAGPAGSSGDGGPAQSARLRSPVGLAIGADGSLYIAGRSGLARVRPVLPGGSAGEITIASQDRQQLYVFTPAGRHLRTLHALTGATLLEFRYDAGGLLEEVVDGSGNRTRIERGPAGEPRAVVSDLGERTGLATSSNGYLEELHPPDGRLRRMDYDAGGLLLRFENAAGEASRFEYDRLGRLLRDSSPSGHAQVLRRTELENGFEVVLESPQGRHVAHEVTRSETGVEVSRTSVGDGDPSVQRRDATETRVSVNADRMEIVTQSAGDPRFGMQAPLVERHSVRTPGGLEARILATRRLEPPDPSHPSGLDSLSETIELNGDPVELHYEASSRTLTTTSPEGRESRHQLDALGRIVRVQQPGLAALAFAYDPKGRAKSVRWEGSSETRETRVEYDALGRPSRLLDSSGAALELDFDPAGRLTRQAYPGGGSLEIEYDTAGRLSRVHPPARPAHEFTLSAEGRLLEYRLPPAGGQSNAIRYRYDADGLVSQIERPDGKLLRFERDGAGRAASLIVPEGVHRYERVGSGWLGAVVSPNGQRTEIQYDGALPTVFRQTGAVEGSVEVGLDSRFLPVSETVNGAERVQYGYDRDGKLTSAGPLQIGYEAGNGRLLGSTLGSVSDRWTFNEFGETASYRAHFQDTELFSAEFARDRVGRILEKTETVSGVMTRYRYAYDAGGRLVEVTRDGQLWLSLELDGAGNAVLTQRPGETMPASYDVQDRLLELGDVRFEYGPAGELLREVGPARSVTYAHDVLGNLRSVVLGDRNIEYRVDGLSRRIGRLVDGGHEQRFLYRNGYRPVAELDDQNRVVSRFVYGNRAVVPSFMIREGKTYRILSDLRGSPRLVVDTVTGQIAQRIDYDPLGRIVLDTNPGFQPFGFVGGLADPDTELVRLGVRDYDPRSGRFITRDPLLFASGDPNFYRYALGDPVNLSDPDGDLVAIALGGALVGGSVNTGIAIGGALLRGEDVTLQLVANAFISGAIAGSIGALAGPIGGTVATVFGRLAGSALGRSVTVALSTWGGVIAQYVANRLTGDHTINPCIGGLATGLGAGVAARNIGSQYAARSLSQTLNQGPSVYNTLFLQNVTGRLVTASTAISTGISGVTTAAVPFLY